MEVIDILISAKLELFEQLCGELRRTIAEKNALYGDKTKGEVPKPLSPEGIKERQAKIDEILSDLKLVVLDLVRK